MKNNYFGKNITNYCYANNLSRPQFADMLNSRMEKYSSVKIYDKNDIWTYEVRGSRPKDENAISEICNILGRTFNELVSREFSMEEFEIASGSKNKNSVAEEQWTDWDITRLDELTEQEKDFVIALVSSLDWETRNGKDSAVAIMDVGIYYDGGKTVEASIYFGEEDDKLSKKWTWKEYGEIFEDIDTDNSWGENDIVGLQLEHEIIEKFEKIGLIYDFYVFRSDDEEDYVREGTNMDRCYIANIWLNIDRRAVLEILKLAVERARSKLMILEGEKFTKLEMKKERHYW